MKLSSEYLLITRDASVDANDQTVTLYKIIDNFTFGYKKEEFESFRAANPGQPVAFPIPHMIATSWKLDKPTDSNVPFKIRTKLLDPSGAVLGENSQEAVIAKGNDKVRFNIASPAIPVTEAGKYSYQVTAYDDNDKEITTATTLFNVILKAED